MSTSQRSFGSSCKQMMKRLGSSCKHTCIFAWRVTCVASSWKHCVYVNVCFPGPIPRSLLRRIPCQISTHTIEQSFSGWMNFAWCTYAGVLYLYPPPILVSIVTNALMKWFKALLLPNWSRDVQIEEPRTYKNKADLAPQIALMIRSSLACYTNFLSYLQLNIFGILLFTNSNIVIN